MLRIVKFQHANNKILQSFLGTPHLPACSPPDKTFNSPGSSGKYRQSSLPSSSLGKLHAIRTCAHIQDRIRSRSSLRESIISRAQPDRASSAQASLHDDPEVTLVLALAHCPEPPLA